MDDLLWGSSVFVTVSIIIAILLGASLVFPEHSNRVLHSLQSFPERLGIPFAYAHVSIVVVIAFIVTGVIAYGSLPRETVTRKHVVHLLRSVPTEFHPKNATTVEKLRTALVAWGTSNKSS